VANIVEFIGGGPGLDVGGDHAQLFGCQLACDPHFFDIFRCFDDYAHSWY